jgi:hypothetical protein
LAADSESASIEERTRLRRVRDWIGGRIRELATRHFWIEVGASGDEFFMRFGPAVMLTFITAELVEHSVIPFPAFCFAIQAACALWGQQTQEILNSRYRYPLGLSLRQRVGVGVKMVYWKFQFWRAMRKVYSLNQPEFSVTKSSAVGTNSVQRMLLRSPFWPALLQASSDELPVDPATERSVAEVLDPSLTPPQRFAAAQLQMAYYDLQLKWAKTAIAPWATDLPSAYLKLRRGITRQYQALDAYGLVLRRIAYGPAPTDFDFATLIQEFEQQQSLFMRGFKSYMQAVQRGSIPFADDVHLQVFTAPKKVFIWLRTLQKTGDCESELVGRAEPTSHSDAH